MTFSIYKALTMGDLFCSGTIFLFSILALIFYFISDYSYLTQIPQNWTSSLIFPKENQICNNPASAVQIGQWPGITNACDCSTDPFSLFQVFRRRCKIDLHEGAFCTNINAVEPISYYKWRNLNFCGSTQLKNLNYKTLFFDNSNSNFFIRSNSNGCTGSSRSCGEIDSVRNVLCVNTAYECPVNFMKFVPVNQDLPKDDKNYTKIAADGGTFLISGDFVKQKILVDLKVSDAQPCASPYYSNSNSTTYILEYAYGYDKCNKKIGDDQYDSRYGLIDNYAFKALTTQNGVWNIISALPKYPADELNKQTGLYARPYIGIATRCLEDLRRSGKADKFYEEIQNLKSDVSYLFGILIAGMVIAIIHSCIVFASNIKSVCGGSGECCDQGSMLLIGLFFFIPAIILKIIAYSQLSKTLEKDILIDTACVDTLTMNASLNYYEKSATSASFVLITILGLVYVALSSFIKFAFRSTINSGEGAIESTLMENPSRS